MAQDCGNVLMGMATVWYGPAGSVEAMPDETSVAYGADWGGSWTEFGVTGQPLAFGVETDTVERMVEQRLMPVATRRSAQRIMFETALAEITIANLAIVLDGTTTTVAAATSQKGYEEFSLDANDFSIDVRSFGFEGLYVDDNGVDQPFRVYIRKGNAFMNGNMEFSREGEGVDLPFQVVALDDCSGVAPVRVQRVSAAATA